MIASFVSTATADATKTEGGLEYLRQPVIAQVLSEAVSAVRDEAQGDECCACATLDGRRVICD